MVLRAMYRLWGIDSRGGSSGAMKELVEEVKGLNLVLGVGTFDVRVHSTLVLCSFSNTILN